MAQAISEVQHAGRNATYESQSSRIEVGSFYRGLRQEVTRGNPLLSEAEQELLQSHYPTIMSAKRRTAGLAEEIYVARRAPAVDAICATHAPVVLDAGCAFGSESFLFAKMGATVLAVDADSRAIAIAEKRHRYYEEVFDRPLDIRFRVADLNDLEIGRNDLSLTWIASVLAAIPDQDTLLRRIYLATRPGGKVMVTDMNLLNPIFVSREFLRRRRAKQANLEFAREADFWSMVTRRGRHGARYYDCPKGGRFDDVQFFSPITMSAALRQSGFRPDRPVCNGFALPLFGRYAVIAERIIGRLPGVNRLGYFYLASATK